VKNWIALAVLTAVTLGCGGEMAKVELKPGDTAPSWTTSGSDGTSHSLADYREKQAVVLAWFPKAFTGG
jgi:peroxiredoxin Q/BCP